MYFDVLRALVMDAARTSETSVNFYQSTRRCNPEGARRLCVFHLVSTDLRILRENRRSESLYITKYGLAYMS
jgi:hypothetical protein